MITCHENINDDSEKFDQLTLIDSFIGISVLILLVRVSIFLASLFGVNDLVIMNEELNGLAIYNFVLFIIAVAVGLFFYFSFSKIK